MGYSEGDLRSIVHELAVEFKRLVYGKPFSLIRSLPERNVLQKLILLYLGFAGASQFMVIVKALNLHKKSVYEALKELERKRFVWLDSDFCWRVREDNG